jgi:AcrR family transcriptional regulator
VGLRNLRAKCSVARSRDTEHPTRTLLVATATNLIEQHGPNGFTVETLLQESGVSKGSLYHHFHDFTDVLEESVVRTYMTSVEEDLAALAWMIGENPTPEHLRETLLSIVRLSSTEHRAPQRMRRVHLLSMSDHGTAGMREKLAHHQTRSIEALADIVRRAQELKVVRDDFDPVATAAVVLSLVFGRVVSDVSENPIPDEKWTPTIMKFLETAFV